MLEGSVDLAYLEKALFWTARVHDAFRARLDISGEGGPAWVIAEAPLFDWRFVKRPGRVDEHCRSILQADRNKRFDLVSGPLSRWCVVQGDDGRRLIWSHHHILFDGWSLNLVVGTISRAYALLQKGEQQAVLVAPSMAEFAEWWLRKPVRSCASWLARPWNGGRMLNPENERPRGKDFGAVKLDLSADLTHSLTSLCRTHETSLHQLLLAAWAVVWARQTGAREVVFGVVLALRPAEVRGIDETVGCLMNTLPIHIQIARNLRELLANVHEGFLRVVDNSTASLPRALAEMRGQGWNGSLESVVVFENYPGDKGGAPLGELGRLTVQEAIERPGTPLTLVALPGEHLGFELIYEGQERERARAARLCTLLEGVLRAFLTL